MTTMDDIRQAKAEADRKYEIALRGVSSLGAQFIGQKAKALFDEHPALQSFQWSHEDEVYNDETYEPEIHRDDYYILINGISHDETYDYDRQGRTRKTESKYADIEPLFAVVADFLAQFSEDDLWLMFGEDNTITIDREGATLGR